LLKKSEAGVVFTTGDQVGIAGIGFILAFGTLLFTWPRVWANSERVRVRNIFSTKNVPWGVVSGVGVTSGAAWAVLDLHDDDQVAMLGLQVGDGEYALAAMKRLRQLHQQATGPAKATGENA
ncbi:MAG: PH domain-containing protein, partial [Antricoccus sp.]